MGWDFCKTWKTTADVVKSITQGYGVQTSKLIKQRVEKGCDDPSHVLWTIGFSKPSKEHPVAEAYIGCFLIQKVRGEWGYKALCESMGPCYYDCPLEYLQQVPIASVSWRKQVVAFHEGKEIKQPPQPTFNKLVPFFEMI